MSQETTNMELVTRSVFRHGKANVEQVQADCPMLTRPQILRALHNAKNRGHVHSAGLQTVLRADGLRHVGVFAAGQQPPSKEEVAASDARNGWRFGRVASVWDLGQGVSV